MNRTRVMIVDDHQVVRAGLKTLINGQPDLSVVTEASSGREAMEQLRQHTIDVLLLDLSLPDVSGLDVLKHAKAHYESVGVLILSAFPEAQYGLNVLRGGASGFVGKGTEESELFRAIRTVARGGRYVGPELAGRGTRLGASGTKLPVSRLTSVNSGPRLTPWQRLKSDPFGSFVRPAACW